MTSESAQAVDWQGRAFDCQGCADEAKPAGRCTLMQACVRDRYAKRIDRFFSWNPGLAKDYLDHPYFEVRACAVRHADVFHLPSMMDDPDETVRWSTAQRLTRRYLLCA
ncbi:MAG: 4Fe4S-binding leucine-rich repeat protein [Halothiobacillus sp.]